jgi:hypothetical protein
MAFGYPQLYANGLNNNSQLRRSTDMVYQRGGTYQINLTGDTYIPSMELDVDLFAEDAKVGRMSIVPFDVTQSGATFTYRFNLRPYTYMSNYVQAQHYQTYWKNDWYTTSVTNNINNQYPNIVKANYKYGYKYLSGTTLVTEYTGSPSNNINHYTDIPFCQSSTGFTASGFTNTGNYFDYVGGAFQMDEHFILPNFDQEIGTVMGTGVTINTVDLYRRLSPMSQFLFDSPTMPQPSQTSRFLTDAPRIQYVQTSDNYVLYHLAGQTGDRQVMETDFLVLQFYNESNTRINYVQQQLTFAGTEYASPTGFTDNLNIFTLPVGPVDIVNIYSNIDWTNVAYYTAQIFYGYPTNVELRNSVGPVGPLSEAFYFYITENCQPQNTRVVFLNARGGFDYFTFKSYRNDTKKIKSTTYDSRYYATNLSSPDRNYGRSVKTFDTDVNREIVLESEFLSVEEGNWLEQLFYSPQVYIDNGDYISPMDRQDKYYKDLTPVQVLSTEVEKITKKHRKLNKYKITLGVSSTFFVNKGF